MTNQITFNTGRPYSTEGQIITATIVGSYICDMFGDERLIVFMEDQTRMIDQYLDLSELTEKAIMQNYDNSYYVSKHKKETQSYKIMQNHRGY